jgi:RHS repeat-associated protein
VQTSGLSGATAISAGYGHSIAVVPGTITYTHDGNGNLTGSSAGLALAYNAKDQTTSVTPPAGTALAMTYTGASQVQRVAAGGDGFKHGLLGLSSRADGGGTAYYTRDAAGTRFRQRFYDPGLGHWTQRNPLLTCSTKLQEVNQYAYVGGDPANRTDPSGLLSFDDCVNLLSAIGGPLGFWWTCSAACAALLITTVVGGVICQIYCGIVVNIGAWAAASYACLAILGPPE